MRSPFTRIRDWLDDVLEVGAGIVETLRGILQTIEAHRRTIASLEFPESAPVPPIKGDRVDAIAARVDDLTLAVKEGVNNVQRSERRVRAVVASARKELAEHGYEHAGLEAENTELRELNAEGGDEEALSLVPESVEDLPRIASPIPGVSIEHMVAARARRR